MMSRYDGSGRDCGIFSLVDGTPLHPARVAAANNSAAQVAFRAKELELLGRLPGINPNPYRWPNSAPKGRPRHTTTPAACELTATSETQTAPVAWPHSLSAMPVD